jgi:hypothetical protein
MMLIGACGSQDGEPMVDGVAVLLLDIGGVRGRVLGLF